MDIRKIRFALVLVLAIFALAATGCELEDDADADGTTTNTNTSTNTNTGTNTNTTDTTVNPGLPYRYVRVNDQSTAGDTINSGADIDAVILDKADGGQVFANTVELFEHGGGFAEGPDLDPSEALGSPDSFSDFDSADPICDLDAGYVSLGGGDGVIVVGMPEEIEAGD